MDAGTGSSAGGSSGEEQNGDGGSRDAATGDGGSGDGSSVDGQAPEGGASALLCSADQPCPNGMQCVGTACNEPWRCEPGPSKADCGELSVSWCGCDGVTSTGCSPDRPYVSHGVCPGEAMVDCDDRRVRPECGAPPTCAKGEVPAIREDGCWGGWCVMIGFCKCAEREECPNTDIYTCWLSGQCGPFTF